MLVQYNAITLICVMAFAQQGATDDDDEGEAIDKSRDEKVPGEANVKTYLDAGHLFRANTQNREYVSN